LIKAGLLEIADLIVVNKCDLPDANRLMQALHAELAVDPGQTAEAAKGIDVLGVEAKHGVGGAEVLARLRAYDAEARTESNATTRRRRRILGELRRAATSTLARAMGKMIAADAGAELIERLERGEEPMESAVRRLLADTARKVADTDH